MRLIKDVKDDGPDGVSRIQYGFLEPCATSCCTTITAHHIHFGQFGYLVAAVNSQLSFTGLLSLSEHDQSL